MCGRSMFGSGSSLLLLPGWSPPLPPALLAMWQVCCGHSSMPGWQYRGSFVGSYWAVGAQAGILGFGPHIGGSVCWTRGSLSVAPPASPGGLGPAISLQPPKSGAGGALVAVSILAIH